MWESTHSKTISKVITNVKDRERDSKPVVGKCVTDPVLFSDSGMLWVLRYASQVTSCDLEV